MEPSTMRIPLLSLSTFLLSVSFILLSTTPTATTFDIDPSPASTWDPQILNSIVEATNWIFYSKSMIRTKGSSPCNAPPYLSYLRSHVQLILVPTHMAPRVPEDQHPQNGRYFIDEAVELLALQPLVYSFYVKNVLEPYRSRLAEANAPSTSFCLLGSVRCELQYGGKFPDYCHWKRDANVCMPNSDATTEGTCVGCSMFQTDIEKRNITDEVTLGYLRSACGPRPEGHGPNPVPERNENEARYLRWFLESSFVFEKKKAGERCSASPGLSKARAYLDILMKKHFGRRNEDANVSLSTPGMEGEEEESLYDAVRSEVKYNRREFYEEKLKGIEEGKKSFGEVYCSREEGLVCVEGKCRSCGDERVRGNEDLEEACHPEEGGGGRGRKGRAGGSDGSSGTQQDGRQSSELSVLLGIVSSIAVMFGW